jgi:hypothetical protein
MKYSIHRVILCHDIGLEEKLIREMVDVSFGSASLKHDIIFCEYLENNHVMGNFVNLTDYCLGRTENIVSRHFIL